MIRFHFNLNVSIFFIRRDRFELDNSGVRVGSGVHVCARLLQELNSRRDLAHERHKFDSSTMRSALQEPQLQSHCHTNSVFLLISFIIINLKIIIT